MRGSFLFVVIAMVFHIFALAGLNGEDIRPDTVVLCYFGSGDGQIGVYHNDMQYGPEYFGIDENGNVYVDDQTNGRIIGFDTNGKVLRYYKCTGSISGIVAFKGRVYFGFGDQIVIYDTSGKLIKEIKNAWAPRLDHLNHLHAICGYPKVGEIWEIIFDENFDMIAVLRSSSYSYRSADRYYIFTGANELAIREFVIEGRGKNARERVLSERVVKCDPYEEDISGTFIEGEDMEGNIYIQVLSGNIGGRKFIKLSPEGEFLGQLVVGYGDWEIWGDLGHAVRVSPRGDLYLANMDEEKYWIVRYPTEMFRKP